MRKFIYLFAAAIFGSSAIASATTMPAVDFGGGVLVTPVGETIGGWQFEVTEEVFVNSLGFFDVFGATDTAGVAGLLNDHFIGLWTDSGSLIASATVTNSSTVEASASPLGQWLFEDLTDKVILKEGVYRIGATFADRDDDFAILASLQSTTPLINFLTGAQASGTGLTFPDQLISVGGGVFGPNLSVTAVPLPASWLLLMSGIGGIVLLRRRARSIPA